MKSEKKGFYFIFTLMFLIVAVGSLTTYTFAKYVSQKHDGWNATVATFLIDFSSLYQDVNTYSLSLNEMDPTKTGENAQVYTFNVVNYSNASISETALTYNLRLTTTGNLPLDIVLKRANAEVATLSPEILTGTTATSAMTADVQQTDEYSLLVSWNQSFLSSEYSNLVDYLTIQIEWEQID